jgi:muramidase (phage lysozyme)
VAPHPKALLDTIAFAEGTRGRGQDGFNVIFTYKYFSDCGRHPRAIQCSGRLCSDAAGRYQFLSTTWSRLGLPTFNPENQERGALKLVSGRGVSLPAGRALTATEFNNAMDRLSYEWASLPPGRYGQPSYSYTALRRTYCGFAGC